MRALGLVDRTVREIKEMRYEFDDEQSPRPSS
jgi:hypothetical protein